MESKLAIKKSAIDYFKIKYDDNEHHSRILCIHIYGLDFNSNKDNIVIVEAEKCHRDVGIVFNQNKID